MEVGNEESAKLNWKTASHAFAAKEKERENKDNQKWLEQKDAEWGEFTWGNFR